ncbi:MAG: class I SAM-dependent rRNA methyltransferase [Planctomycetota bacterium]
MADAVATVCLKRGCAKPLHAGHPWVFADAVARIEGQNISPGSEVRVVDDRGTCIGRGFYSPHSAIAVRIITRADAPITPSLIESRIDEALRLRRDVLHCGTGVGQASCLSRTPTSGTGCQSVSTGKMPVLQAGKMPALPDNPELAAIEEQLAKIQSFAALYGMDALEETAALRKRREELLKSLGAAAGSAGVPAGLGAGNTQAGETPALPGRPTDAYRLVNSEGDGLGGLTVDVYGDYVALQIGTPGMARCQETILNTLASRLAPQAILDRSDAHTWQLEKMSGHTGAVLRGQAPEAAFPVHEHGLEMLCDLRRGHSQKTGLFLDQRENRRRFAAFAPGRNVLDVFCYSGGFAVHAARAGAKSITLLDSSAEALELARANLERNGIKDADLIQAEWTEGFKRLREAGRLFDLLVLDPPKFARGKDNVAQALTAYRDLNAQAARLLAPGGLLFTCSCSGNVSEVEFERAVAGGLRLVERRAMLLERRGAAPDHPVPPGFDQGRYLKCLVLQVL